MLEPAIPPIGQIDLHFSAEATLRADRKHVADNEHPDHEHRIDRRSARVGVVGRQLLVHPAEIEHCVDPANQMIRRHHLVEVELVEELALPIFPPTHHRRTPLTTASARRNHGSHQFSMGVLQHIPPKIGRLSDQSRGRSRYLQKLGFGDFQSGTDTDNGDPNHYVDGRGGSRAPRFTPRAWSRLRTSARPRGIAAFLRA